MRFEEIEEANPSQLDFVPRARRNQAIQILIAFTITMALIFVFSYSPALNRSGFGPIIAIAIVAALCIYVVVSNQKNLDLVMSTEYQNLLFAQGMALGTSFCIFVRRNGTIVYADKGVSDIFGHHAYAQSQALESVFEHGGLAVADRERIMNAIYQNRSDRIVFPVVRAGGTVTYVLTVEPIPRPAGYALLRGREYRGERSGLQLLPEQMRSTSIEKLDHLLRATPVAHYVTDMTGRFEYTSPGFEQAAGYNPGEILSLGLSLRDTFQQFGEMAIDAEYVLNDFGGQAVLRRKDGTIADGLLFQNVVRDEQGRNAGATGTVVTPSLWDR